MTGRVVTELFLNYYQELLGQKASIRRRVYKGFIQNGPLLITELQLNLLHPIEEKEDKQALFQIDSNKSPRPDGDIIEAILDFFRNGRLLKQINFTSIALIAKQAERCSKLLSSRQSVNTCALMKIDLRKAYDMVSWEFLEEILLGYGFPERFV
ncbi:uncharacterized protein [Nicotiana sylvestris]|uniref:uncharacterized protein n=1 Tax=Nicotiana sylvestris TaxID=4096 RepID=UPI00388CA8E8